MLIIFKGGLKMVNISNFMASLKYSSVKKLTTNHGWTLGFFLSINGNDFAKKLTDFGDDFL